MAVLFLLADAYYIYIEWTNRVHADYADTRRFFRHKNKRTYFCHADGADTRRLFWLTQNARNAQIFLRQKNRRTDLFLTQRRRGREAICSFVLLSKTAEEGTSRASKSL